MFKLRLAALLVLIAASVTCLSAGSAQEPAKKDAKAPPDKAAPVTPPPTTGDGKVDFSLKLKADTPFYQEVNTKTSQSIKVQGMEVNQTQDQTFDFKWTPVKFEAGKWTIKQTIEGLKMNVDIAGNPIRFDSENPAPAGSNNQLYDFFKSLKSSEFTLTLNDKFKVEKIEGRDEFINKAGQANDKMKDLLKTILSEEALKQMADPVFGFIPPEPKKVGDTWKSTTTLNLGPLGTYDNTSTYTFKSKEADDKSIVEVQSEIAYKPPTTNDPGLPFKIKAAELKTKDKTPGKLVYNGKTGRLESAELMLKMTGTITVEIGGTTTTVELIQDQTTTVKSADKSFMPEKKGPAN